MSRKSRESKSASARAAASSAEHLDAVIALMKTVTLPSGSINAAATLICLSLIALVRNRQAVIAKEEMSLTNLLAGLKFVYRTKIILGTITLDLFAVLLGGATALLPIYAKDILQAGPHGLGHRRVALVLRVRDRGHRERGGDQGEGERADGGGHLRWSAL